MTIKRPSEHVLEDESRLAFKSLLPAEWVVRDIHPDYAIDMEIEIFEDGVATEEVLGVQIKATESEEAIEKPCCQMETRHLKHYDNWRIPIVLVYWIKPAKIFYYVFAQNYIREVLSKDNPRWREQSSVTIHFASESRLENPRELKRIAQQGYFYIITNKLGQDRQSSYYWLDGIPRSDDEELKAKSLKASRLMDAEKYNEAITKLEDILKSCTISPIQRMSILYNIGNSYYALCNNQEALKYYHTVLAQQDKVDADQGLEGRAYTLMKIGEIQRDMGKLDDALKSYTESVAFFRKTGNQWGEVSYYCNIGLIHRDRRELKEALESFNRALTIDVMIGNTLGQVSTLFNIAVILEKLGDFKKALEIFEMISHVADDIEWKKAKADSLSGKAVTYTKMGEFDNALRVNNDALGIYRELEYKEGEAVVLGNIGAVYLKKHELEKALEFIEKGLEISQRINYRVIIPQQLQGIACVHIAKALPYLEKAVAIHNELGNKSGEVTDLLMISTLLKAMSDGEEAWKAMKKVDEVLATIKLKKQDS